MDVGDAGTGTDSFNVFLCVLVMPSKATIFNGKCDIVWELSSGAKNVAYYSFDGLHLALCGFGNVAGNIEIW
jgi:translation initiation factor 2A